MPLADIWAEGKDIDELPSIGKDLAEKIKTMVETGKLPLLEKIQSQTPATLSDLMCIEGLGPKRVKALHEHLNILNNDLQGDLHCHTNASDGCHTLSEMVEAAKARHYQYISINDHSKLWWTSLFGATIQNLAIFIGILTYVGSKQRNAYV